MCSCLPWCVEEERTVNSSTSVLVRVQPPHLLTIKDLQAIANQKKILVSVFSPIPIQLFQLVKIDLKSKNKRVIAK